MNLDKIFDYNFNIPSVKYNKSSYIIKKLKMTNTENYFFQIICLEIISYLNLSLRNIDKYLLYIGKTFKAPDASNTEVCIFVNSLFVPYFVATNLFNQKLYDDLMNENLDDYLKFCERKKILEKIRKIYGESYEPKLFQYFSHDCKLLIRQIKNEKYLTEKYYIKVGDISIIERYLKEIDILDFFISNTRDNK